MSQKSTIKCKPMDSTYALCNVNGKQVKCKNKPNTTGLACHPPTDSEGNLTCDPIDFTCDLSKEPTPSLLESFGLLFVPKQQPKLTPKNTIETVKIDNIEYFYYFAYNEHHLNRLNKMHERYTGTLLPTKIWDVMRTQTKAGTLTNYTRNFIANTNVILSNEQVINTSVATLFPNKNKSASGLIIPLPIYMLQVLDQDKANLGFHRMIVKPQIVIGPLESDKGGSITCITYIADAHTFKGLSISPRIEYLAEIATMLRDRRLFGLGQKLYTRKYTINILMDDEDLPKECVYLIYNTDNTWSKDTCGFKGAETLY
jgi:hypothetical protein